MRKTKVTIHIREHGTQRESIGKSIQNSMSLIIPYEFRDGASHR